MPARQGRRGSRRRPSAARRSPRFRARREDAARGRGSPRLPAMVGTAGPDHYRSPPCPLVNAGGATEFVWPSQGYLLGEDWVAQDQGTRPRPAGRRQFRQPRHPHQGGWPVVPDIVRRRADRASCPAVPLRVRRGRSPSGSWFRRIRPPTQRRRAVLRRRSGSFPLRMPRSAACRDPALRGRKPPIHAGLPWLTVPAGRFPGRRGS